MKLLPILFVLGLVLGAGVAMGASNVPGLGTASWLQSKSTNSAIGDLCAAIVPVVLCLPLGVCLVPPGGGCPG